MSIFDAFKILPPKGNPKKAAVSTTPTFDGTGNPLSLPTYREHLEDIFSSRTANNTQELVKGLMYQDPDVSAATNAYLTLADTDYQIHVTDIEGEEDAEGLKDVQRLVTALTTTTDYTLKFQRNKSLKQVAADMRFMLLMRGSIGNELVFDKFLMPSEIKHVDTGSIKWTESKPNVFKPSQEQQNGDDINLDIPNFFFDNYRQNPTDIYSYSPFTAAVNTIAARQQVINDLYRIMQRTGYPRIDITVAEEVLRKSMPELVKDNPIASKQWMTDQINAITTQVNSLRADSALVHTDAFEASLLNEGGPSKSMDVKSIIEVLNSANQSALKTMATVIGRGDSGINTSTTEARIFAMSADQLNVPIANILSQMFTYAMRLGGSESIVRVEFKKAEMRPPDELEPQLAAKQARYLTLLSYGIISDTKFHRDMFGTPKPEGIEDFSGTNFLTPDTGDGADSDISPNADPLGRSVSKGDGAAKSNAAGKS